jgi:hypothetical protein
MMMHGLGLMGHYVTCNSNSKTKSRCARGTRNLMRVMVQPLPNDCNLVQDSELAARSCSLLVVIAVRNADAVPED